MNPNFANSKADRMAIRNSYIKNLQLETSNNLLNYNANQMFKATGALPPSVTAMVDTRSITEKYADIQKNKVALLAQLKDITDGANANEIVDKIPAGEITVLLNNMPAIIKEIKDKWSLGIPAPAFLQFWNNYKLNISLLNDSSALPISSQNILFSDIQGLNQLVQTIMPTEVLYAQLTNIIIGFPDSARKQKALQVIKSVQQINRLLNANLTRASDPSVNEQTRIGLTQVLGELLQRTPTATDVSQLINDAQLVEQTGSNPGRVLDNIGNIGPEFNEQEIEAYENMLEETQSEASQGEVSVAPSLSAPSASAQSIGLTTHEATTPQQTVEPYIPQTIEEYRKLKYTGANQRIAVAKRIFQEYPELANELKENITDDPIRVKDALKSKEDMKRTNADRLIERYLSTGRGLVMGRGLSKGSVKTKQAKLKINPTKKVEKVAPYIEFGAHLLHLPHLEGGKLQMRYKSGSAIINIPSQPIGGKLKKVLLSMTGSSSPTFEDINELNDHEKKLLNTIVKECKINQRFLVPTPDRNKEEQDFNRLQILSGEINAGNDNPKLVKEIKVLLLRLKNCRRIPLRHYNEIISDLISLGY